MLVKNIIFEDFVQYKKPSMFIATDKCSWKCELDYGKENICQNSDLAKSKNIFISTEELVKMYLKNNITSSVVFGGLEPIDSFLHVFVFISKLRNKYNCEDDVVIYTGYKEEEIQDIIKKIKSENLKNIIIKFGRFIPNEEPHYDQILGVKLASNNQYAKRII